MNPNAVSRSRRYREEIARVWRTQWLEYTKRFPPGQPPTEKTISEQLSFTMAPSTVYWHMEQIRTEVARAECCNPSNSSDGFRAA
jgi:hypothetical protein